MGAPFRKGKLLLILAAALLAAGVVWLSGRGTTPAPAVISAPEETENPALAGAAPAPAQMTSSPVALEQGAESPLRETAGVHREVDRRMKLFPGAVLVAQDDSAPDAEGYVTHIELLQTNFKYPLVRIVDRRKQDSETGDWIVTDQLAMVATHVLVTKAAELSGAEFHALVKRSGGEILAQVTDLVFRVGFDGRDPHSLDQMIEKLQQAGAVVQPEPDYIRFLNG